MTMRKLKVSLAALAAERYRQAVARDAPFLELVQLRLEHERARAREIGLA